MPLEHDDRCSAQDHDLTLLKEQFRRSDVTLEEVTHRLQELVAQYHAQNVTQAIMLEDMRHVRGKVDAISLALKQDFALRSEFVELKGQWHKFLGTVLVAVLVTALALVLRTTSVL